MSELLPCPFCGEAADLVGEFELDVVACQTCYARTDAFAGDGEHAAAAWNRRAANAPADPAVLALAKLGASLLRRSWNEGVGFCDSEWLQDDLDGDAVSFGLADKGPNVRLGLTPGIADAIARLLAPTDGDA